MKLRKNQLSEQEARYDKAKTNAEISAKISEAYTFGNNLFLKVYFESKGFFTKSKTFKEEWTFTKSCLSEGPEWYLSNIEQGN